MLARTGPPPFPSFFTEPPRGVGVAPGCLTFPSLDAQPGIRAQRARFQSRHKTLLTV